MNIMKFINQNTEAIIFAKQSPVSYNETLKDGDMVEHYHNVQDVRFRVPIYDRSGYILSYGEFNISKSDLKDVMNQIKEIESEIFDTEYDDGNPF